MDRFLSRTRVRGRRPVAIVVLTAAALAAAGCGPDANTSGKDQADVPVGAEGSTDLYDGDVSLGSDETAWVTGGAVRVNSADATWAANTSATRMTPTGQIEQTIALAIEPGHFLFHSSVVTVSGTPILVGVQCRLPISGEPLGCGLEVDVVSFELRSGDHVRVPLPELDRSFVGQGHIRVLGVAADSIVLIRAETENPYGGSYGYGIYVWNPVSGALQSLEQPEGWFNESSFCLAGSMIRVLSPVMGKNLQWLDAVEILERPIPGSGWSPMTSIEPGQPQSSFGGISCSSRLTLVWTLGLDGGAAELLDEDLNRVGLPLALGPGTAVDHVAFSKDGTRLVTRLVSGTDGSVSFVGAGTTAPEWEQHDLSTVPSVGTVPVIVAGGTIDGATLKRVAAAIASDEARRSAA